MKQATHEQRETVRRAIHTVFSHLSAGALRELAERQQAVNYAGAQLGTSSQAKAHTEKMAAIDNAVDNLADFYIRQMADYIAPEANERTAV